MSSELANCIDLLWAHLNTNPNRITLKRNICKETDRICWIRKEKMRKGNVIKFDWLLSLYLKNAIRFCWLANWEQIYTSTLRKKKEFQFIIWYFLIFVCFLFIYIYKISSNKLWFCFICLLVWLIWDLIKKAY